MIRLWSESKNEFKQFDTMVRSFKIATQSYKKKYLIILVLQDQQSHIQITKYS